MDCGSDSNKCNSGGRVVLVAELRVVLVVVLETVMVLIVDCRSDRYGNNSYLGEQFREPLEIAAKPPSNHSLEF